MAFQTTWTRAALFASGLRTGCFSVHTPPVAGLVADKSLLLVSSIQNLRRSVCSTSNSEACTVTGDQTDEGSTSTDGVNSNEPQHLPLPSAVRTVLLSRGLDVRRGFIWHPQGLVGTSLGLLPDSLDVSRGFATVSNQPAKKQKLSAKQRSAATTSSQTPNPSNKRSESEEQLLAATAPSKTKSDGTIGVRFYKEVGVEKVESGYRVLLDGRALRSPAKRPLILPTKELALAIAAEWEWQDATNIRPFTMPLMKLASTATDLVPLQRPAIIENLMKYFRSSDAVCVREPRGGALLQKQEGTWDPILEWMQEEIGVRPVTSDSIFGAAQPEEIVQKVQEVLAQKSDFRLAAVDALASSAHSLVIALAVSRGHLGLRQALEAVRLEEDFQIGEWGLVEGGHDLDIADTRVRIAAPSLFLRLLNE